MPKIAILPLDAHHAQDAARLHMAGQPGTFLTSLGSEALTALYTALPKSPAGFGFVAMDHDGRVVGFVSAATSTGALFLYMLTRRAGHFLPILIGRFVKHPWLLADSLQAAFYPLLTYEVVDDHEFSAELLSIMVEDQVRGRGLGAVLLAALVAECRRRGAMALDVTVDAANLDAQRFYERYDFYRRRVFQLFGRTMYLYHRPLQA
jgi:ribosomal protein S18 acetylase RimI-like enzyme